jgi:hypothetical protein
MAKIKRSDISEEDIFKGIKDSAKESIVSLQAMNSQFKEIAKSIKLVVSTQKLDSTGSLREFSKASAEATKNMKQQLQVQAEIEKVERLQAKAEQELERINTQKAKTQNEILKGTIAQTREQERQTKATERETQAQSKLESVYSRVNQKLGKLRSEYRDLAVRKELGADLTEKEERRYANLQKRIELYDTVLKKVDGTMGLHQRNVGNYASGFNALGSSMNQLTREAPAFANSISTGFMAISNNLPIFFDAISGIKKANEELRAQGQPTTSVLKQIGSSLFSFQTLLSLGVTLLTIYGAKMVDWISNAISPANEALEKQNELRKRQNERIKEQVKYIGQESANYIGLIISLQETNKNSKERLELIETINKKYNTTLQNIQDETLFQDQLNKSIEKFLIFKESEFKIKKNEELLALNLAKQSKIIYEINKQTIDSFKLRQTYDKSLTKKDLYLELELNKKLIEQAKNLNSIKAFGYGSNEELFLQLEELVKRAKSYGINVGNNQLKLNEYNDTLQENTKKIKQNKQELKELNVFISHYAELVKKLSDIEKNTKLTNNQTQFEQELERQKKNIETKNKYSVDELNKLIDEEEQIRLEAEKKEYESEKEKLKNKYEEEYRTKTYSIEEAKKLEEERNLEEELLLKQHLERNAEITIEANKKSIDMHDQLEEEKTKKTEEETKKREEKESIHIMNQQAKAIADFFIQQSNRKIQQIDIEMNMYQKQSDYLKQLAANGNIQAQQSIAKTDKLFMESEKKKVQQLKAQEKIKLAESVFSSYSNHLANKDKNPLLKTITDATILTTFINSLTTNYDGTETTVGDKFGNSPHIPWVGKDQYITRVDKDEKILNPTLSAMTGDLTTMEIAQIVEDKRMGKLVEKHDTVHSTNWASALVINELKELKDIIKNKPENNFEVGEILNGVMHVVETTKRGNTNNRNITRISR